jgi:8-oxo-dGTP diphosphatase
VRGDGDGWVTCAHGHDHWGLHGAAGLLLRDNDRILLQHRATWSHHGGTWGLPGGARDSEEEAPETALREAAEEGEIAPEAVAVRATYVDDHGGWSYTTVLAEIPATTHRPLDVRPRAESIELAWVDRAHVGTRPLHPGFAESWSVLAAAPSRLHLVVDAANVVGSRPDGWWRDRAGATARLRDQLARLTVTGLSSVQLPAPRPDRYDRWWPIVHLVTEGAARDIDEVDSSGGTRGAAPPVGEIEPVRIVRSPGAGDDSIVRTSAALDGLVVVVTADRELRDRCAAVGASVVGPRWLTALL